MATCQSNRKAASFCYRVIRDAQNLIERRFAQVRNGRENPTL
jgi:hypothetical protein